ncbi:MAG: hypothetical protein ABIP56_03745 [Dokdonella sp.]
MTRSISLFAAMIAVALLASACSKPAAPPAQPAAAVVSKQLLQEFAMYQQLSEAESFALAGEIGDGIVERFPGSEQATEVRKTLAEVKAKGQTASDEKRMSRLWIYQNGVSESGGTQNTASIYSNEGGANDRVRLILRRHSAWGLSVYIFGNGKGYNCKGVCKLPATFDGESTTIAAYLPETGEPAIFIKDEKGFIAKMQKTKKISIDLQSRDNGKQTMTFDVGGYEESKFPALSKGGKSAKK